MTNLKNKTIQLIILISIIGLIGGYFYYDFQCSQKLKEEVAGLKMEIVALRNETAGLGENSLEKELITETELIQVSGTVKRIEDGIIVLEGQTASLEEESLKIFPLGYSENKEYQIAVDSKTKIDKEGQEIELDNLEEGNLISVMGKANLFNKQEVVAEMILVFQ